MIFSSWKRRFEGKFPRLGKLYRFDLNKVSRIEKGESLRILSKRKSIFFYFDFLVFFFSR